ncbi:transposase, partial [Didymella exigua CBS 183.55]
SKRCLAAAYDVLELTLRTRLKGIRPKHETTLVNQKLSPIEEQSLIQWILDLDCRGFPPQIIDVRRMADALLAGRGQDPPPPPIGKCWVSRFINRQPELQTKWNRKFHSQRARCEDPVRISAWFRLVEETRLTYRIPDEDVYNFDKTGFMMGVASTSKVVTSSDTVGRATVVQPGNREWVTTIECVNASGWSIPPFLILAGKLHQASWYQDLPPDWTVAVSDNGWTTDELGLDWVKHFNRHTQTRSSGARRLLILDGHSSHATPEFDQYCADNLIITLCMPPHTSHLLQPLDVGCYSPLKVLYGHEVSELARQSIFDVDKLDFLWMYLRIRPTALSESNIKAGFQATGLIPFNPERVLTCLTVVRTPSPPGTTAADRAPWTAETPRTVDQLQQQARLVQDLLKRQSQSPTSQAISQLVKGCQLAMQSATILAQENTKLRASNQRQQRKRQRRRQYIARGGALQVEQAQLLVLQADNVVEEEVQADAAPRRQRAPPTCSKCHVQGHNRTQCR